MGEFSFLWPALFSFLFLVFTILLKLKKSQPPKSTSNKIPPGPPKLPLIGNLHQLNSPLPHHRLADLAKTYGPIMHLKLGQTSIVVVSSPEVAKQVLKDHDVNFTERGRTSIAEIVFYNRKGIGFSPYGEYWRKMRKIATMHLFSAKRVQSFRFIREEEVSNCIASIRPKVGTLINLSDIIFSMTTTMFARTVIGSDHENQHALMPLVNNFLKAIGGFTIVDAFPSLEFIHTITGVKSGLHKLHNEADVILENTINRRKEELKGARNEANNLLDVLLQLQDDPDVLLTTDSVKAVILEMFFGGIDTSVTTIEWAISELLKNPAEMVKAQEELRNVRSKHGKIDESVLGELKYFKALIKETFRLHPPGVLTPRQCREECEINGYSIKLKTELLINVWAIGRDPNHWTEPEKFNPERFFKSEVDFQGFNYELLPFGGGRKKCPGMLLGVADIELLLAELLCHFDWKLPDEMKIEDLDMTESFGLSVRRKNELYLKPVYPNQNGHN